MGARDRRTDDFTEATATRGDRETVRIDPPIALGAAKRRDSKRLITVHEGPVHRVRVGVPPQDLPLDDVEVDELQEAEVEVPAAADDLAAELLATKAALEDNQPPPLDPGDRPTVVGLDAIADDEEDTADRELPEEATDPEQQAVADEPAEVVQLPLSRRPKSAPKVILSDQLQEATARHSHSRETQEMVPVAGVIPKADWATTAVGPMPTAPAESGGSRWIVWTAAAAAIALVAVVGGWLLHRAAAQLPGQEQVAPSAVAAITPTPALRVEPEEAPDPAEDPDEPAQEEQEAPGDDPADEEQAPSPAPDEDAEAEDESPAEDDDEDVEPAPDADPDPEPVARKAAAAQLAGPAEDCGKRRRSATHVVYNTETDDDAPWLALRSRPRTRARLRAKMSDGTKVKVYRQRRGWARVRVMSGPHKGRRGWAHNGWLQTLDCPENAAKSG